MSTNQKEGSTERVSELSNARLIAHLEKMHADCEKIPDASDATALHLAIERIRRQSQGAGSRTPQTARDDLARGPGAWLSESEYRLRKLLAFAYSGSHLYGDDGELQDSRLPPIDYMRDSVEQIENAIHARGMTALSHPQPSPAGEWVPWKPGDALPTRGRYWVTRNDEDGCNQPYACPQYTDGLSWSCSQQELWPILAYWSIPLPPPYAPAQRREPAQPSQGECET
jgi:hypothetical protein